MNIRNVQDLEKLIQLVEPIVRERLAREIVPAQYIFPTVPKTITLAELTGIFRAYVTVSQGCASPNKIAAIRRVRELFNCGLKEAKDVVEGSYRP
jgi:ribosomal protein L7/L12